MTKQNKRVVSYCIFALSCIFVLIYNYHKTTTKPHVNVYLWYNMIPQDVFDSFEKETGIKVVKSFYDSNDIMEAKLITCNSGYDIVFPSFIPYAIRQSRAGIYEKINLQNLKRRSNLDTIITKKFINCSDANTCLIPLFYTVMGILYNKNTIMKIFGTEEARYEMIFHPENLKLLQSHGVNFPSEYIDVFPQLQKYLNMNPQTQDRMERILGCINHINKIKSYVKKFFSSTIINDYMSNEMSVAICSSDNAIRIMKKSQTARFTTCGDYGVIAIECAAIPKGAKNIDNAYKFIDYILRPDIATIIANKCGLFVNTIDMQKSDFFTENDIAKFIFLKPSEDQDNAMYEKICNRLWIKSITSKQNIDIDKQDLYIYR